MAVGYRGEAAAFLKRTVEILLVGLSEDSEHGQREIHVLVIIQTDPRRPEGAVLAIVGDTEPMTKLLGRKTVVQHRAYMMSDPVPFLHVQFDHLAMVGIAERNALTAEINTHVRLHAVIFDKELISGIPRRMIERLDLIHEVMPLRYALKRAVKSRRNIIPVNYTVNQAHDFRRYRKTLDITQELGGCVTVHDGAAEFAAVHGRRLMRPFLPEAQVQSLLFFRCHLCSRFLSVRFSQQR